jgi:hypothetical protein
MVCRVQDDFWMFCFFMSILISSFKFVIGCGQHTTLVSIYVVEFVITHPLIALLHTLEYKMLKPTYI